MSFKIKSRIWVEIEGQIVLGEGRVRLLKAIAETGSLSKAAKQLNMSYKKAWRLIDTVNKNAKQPLVQTSIGGQGGGGAVLTPYGEKLMLVFEKINKNCWEFLDHQVVYLENSTENKL